MNSPAASILVVDDDERLRNLLSEYLTDSGFVVTAVADGREMQVKLEAHKFDLIVLDIMLPDTDGLTLARQIRTHLDSPIIMLSARGEDVDRIVGLEVGADDYLAKPFNPRELLARIRAVLRRKTDTSPQLVSETYCFGPYQLEPQTQTLKRDGSPIRLTTGEYNLLLFMIQRPNRILSRDTILQEIKGYEHNPFDRSIDVQVTRLRQKIEIEPSDPRYIRTVRGSGYMFVPQGGDA